MAAPREHCVIDPQGATGHVLTDAGPLEMNNGIGWTWEKSQAQEAAERIPQGQHVEREEPQPSAIGKSLFVMGRCRGCDELGDACGLHGHKGN